MRRESRPRPRSHKIVVVFFFLSLTRIIIIIFIILIRRRDGGAFLRGGRANFQDVYYIRAAGRRTRRRLPVLPYVIKRARNGDGGLLDLLGPTHTYPLAHPLLLSLLLSIARG